MKNIVASADKQSLSDISEIVYAMLAAEQALDMNLVLQVSNALHELELEVEQYDSARSLVEHYRSPVILLSPEGRIIAQNQPMKQWLANAGAQWQLTGSAFADFKKRIRQTGDNSLLLVELVSNAHHREKMMMVGGLHKPSGNLLMVAVQKHWPHHINQSLIDFYGLSQKELEVLSGLAQGLSTDQISIEMAIKVTTVRQHIKSILKKTNTNSQIEVATMAASVASELMLQPNVESNMAHIDQSQILTTGEYYRDYRRIGWRRFGDQSGKKILLIHGPSFAPGAFAHDCHWARQYQLDVYAIERPGYGKTDLPLEDSDPLTCQVEDIVHVLNELDCQPEVLLTHEVGMIIGLAVQPRLPCVNQLVCVSPSPPFTSHEQFSTMPPQQGVFLYAIRKSPRLVKLMLRILMVNFRRLGRKNWYEAIFQGQQDELDVVLDPQYEAGVMASYYFYSAQGGAGFEVDLQVMIQNWEPLIHKCSVPIHIIHGDRNLTTPLTSVAYFSRLSQPISVDILAGEGLTLALSQAQYVYQQCTKHSEKGADGS